MFDDDAYKLAQIAILLKQADDVPGKAHWTALDYLPEAFSLVKVADEMHDEARLPKGGGQ